LILPARSFHSRGVGQNSVSACPITFICLRTGIDVRIFFEKVDWGLKRELDRVLIAMGCEPTKRPRQKLCSFWQPGFNDHLLRSDGSYAASGSICSRIRCALDSFVAPKNGRMRVRSRESIERNKWWL
jgi:hypothetical protein